MHSIDILLEMVTQDMLIKQGIIAADIMKEIVLFLSTIHNMASAVAMMIAGAAVNA